jgi:RNA polymerase sigma-70 factor (ECF subfamily)
MVIRIAYQNTGNPTDAEDIAQEAFMKLIKAPEFNDEAHIKAWLIRVTINLCKDFKRSFWQKRTGPLTEDWQHFTDTQESILEEIMNLPRHYRNAIYLYYYEGYNVPEISKILIVKENTVSSWLTRARKKLKNLILEGGYQHEQERLS